MHVVAAGSASPPAALLVVGTVVTSETQPGVSYRIGQLLGRGGMGSAYLAERFAPGGQSSVVIKLANPDMADGAVPLELIAMKEAVALGRLNETVPPSPFVVRLVDSGRAALLTATPTPWTAIEYVHGGLEGTTLEDRVTYSLHKTGFGFDRARTAHVVRCLTAGLSAIHQVGVLHRDLSPGNVLCCGFGETEILKIADFGAARALGLNSTFVGMIVGTLGYGAPEAGLASADPSCDVFSLAALVYYTLTGQPYFEAPSPIEAMQLFASDARPRIADHASLVPELASNPQVCRGIDSVLARATSLDPKRRPESPLALSKELLPWLGEGPQGPHSSRRRLETLHVEVASLLPSSKAPAMPDFIVRQRGHHDLVIGSVAWDADGHACLISEQRALFWNGERFIDASRLLDSLGGKASFVQRYDAGGWLFGGESSVLAVVDATGLRDQLRSPWPGLALTAASGRFDDLLAVAAVEPGGTPWLTAVSCRRWLRPLALAEAASISALVRLDEERWLVGGRSRAGGAFAASYSPLQNRLDFIEVPRVRAIIAAAALPGGDRALLAGSGGSVVCIEGGRSSLAHVPGEPDLSAAALDPLGREWLGSLTGLWTRDGPSQTFELRFRADDLGAPFISILADAGRVVAITTNGAVVEGRLAVAPAAPQRP
jgi:serine/threonine protein kinase